MTIIQIPFDEELLPARILRFGRFTCMYEHGRIRNLKAGDVELIRMIYFAVRDKNWRTPAYTIENESIDLLDNGFRISYMAYHSLDDILYRSRVAIATTESSITFSVNGESLSNFRRNRIGICVLHPIKECRGKDVIIERPDGTRYESKFPDLVNPHQPFKEIKNMHCRIGSDVSVALDFEGDMFETEDQRNWADSSYKTYSTPLDIPFPVEVSKGDSVEQKVHLNLTSHITSIPAKSRFPGEKKVVFPTIGYCAGDKLSESDIKLLSELPFDHYRVDLSLHDAHWRGRLDDGISDAIKLKTALELVVCFDDNNQTELGKFIAAVKQDRSIIGSILLLHPERPTTANDILKTTYPRIKEDCPNIDVGYGTNGFFADLNRNRPTEESSFDFVSFAMTPQVHASDTRSVVENLENQHDLIQTAKSFSRGRKIHISPITFKIRTASKDDNGKAADHDPRQHSSLGALFTLQTIKNLCDADRLTFYDVKGYRGILRQAKAEDQSPTFKLLRTIKHFGPKWIIQQDGQETPLADLILENEHGERLTFDCTEGRRKTRVQ